MKSKNKRLIFSTQRTGSTALWKKHESNLIGYEPFNPEESRPEFKDIIKTSHYKNRLEKPLEYIDYLFTFVDSIKIQMEFVPFAPLEILLKSDYDKILLYRQDRKAQYLSLKRAIESKQWWIEKGEKRKEVKINFDESDFKKYSELIDNIYKFAIKHAFNCKLLEHGQVHNKLRIRAVH